MMLLLLLEFIIINSHYFGEGSNHEFSLKKKKEFLWRIFPNCNIKSQGQKDNSVQQQQLEKYFSMDTTID